MLFVVKAMLIFIYFIYFFKKALHISIFKQMKLTDEMPSWPNRKGF